MSDTPNSYCPEFDDDEYEPDEFEEAMSNCGGFFDRGYFVCSMAGSEDCDWDCPFSDDIGLTARQIEKKEE